jgi:hypothetical protein
VLHVFSEGNQFLSKNPTSSARVVTVLSFLKESVANKVSVLERDERVTG